MAPFSNVIGPITSAFGGTRERNQERRALSVLRDAVSGRRRNRPSGNKGTLSCCEPNRFARGNSIPIVPFYTTSSNNALKLKQIRGRREGEVGGITATTRALSNLGKGALIPPISPARFQVGSGKQSRTCCAARICFRVEVGCEASSLRLGTSRGVGKRGSHPGPHAAVREVAPGGTGHPFRVGLPVGRSAVCNFG